MFYIQKEQNIQGMTTSMFYEGDHRWTTNFDERKTYNNQEEASTDLYDFGGVVINEE